MIPLAAAALSVLANLGFRPEAGEDAFVACYLGAGSAPPVAWVRAESVGWLVAIAKHMVPRLANEPLDEINRDLHCPEDAAFVVLAVDRDRLYGVFELIATAYMRHPAQAHTDGLATAGAGDSRPTAMLMVTIDGLLEQAKAGQISPETVVKVLKDVRVGQNKFRAELLEQWGNACAVTSLNVPRLLRASHCKPWAVSSARERLDPSNGLLLAAHLDAAFDTGYIGFAENGMMIFSPQLSSDAQQALGLCAGLRLRQVQSSHRPYLHWHRTHVFLSDPSLTDRPSR
jgi:hypothetical protein